MNYLIQRGKVREQAINVPEGLPELLSDITREVLRCQPTKECLCQFIIDYLHSVIVTREKAMVARSILDRALRQVDSIISDLCICDLSKEKTDMMAMVMEDCFRNFLEKRRCEMRRGKEAISFEDLDIFEELLTKCNFSDEEMAMSRPAIESAYKRFAEAYMAAGRGSDGTDVLYQYFRDRELKRIEEMTRNQAAVTIQAAWRGYWTRSHIIRHVCTCTCMMEDEVDMEAVARDKAARVIQRFFRSITHGVLKPHIDPCGDGIDVTKSEHTTTTTSDRDAVKSVEIPSPKVISATMSPKLSGAALATETTEAVPSPGSPVAEAEVAPEPPATTEAAPEPEQVQETVAEPPAEEEPPPSEPAAEVEAAPADEAPVEEAPTEPAQEPPPPPAEELSAAPPTEVEPAPAVEEQEASSPPPPPPEEEVPPEEPAPTDA